MEKYIVKDGKKLRLGYTTGSCAAAAAKAAAWMLLTGKEKHHISISTPKGIDLNLEVLDIEMCPDHVTCGIEKDSGDDPDITKGTHILASVSKCEEPGIFIDGGHGIGRVTKKGLDQPVGAAAINSVPRKMIRENLEEVCRLSDYRKGLKVVISAPDGEELARKTFNPRLGIIGGISILGTSGIVEPMSEQSLIDTIRIELTQRRAQGNEYILLAPGNYGVDYIRENIDIDPAKAVMTSNFIGESLAICCELGFKGVLLIGHIGKLVKIAGGMLNTHSRYGDCRMEIMTAHAGVCGLSAQQQAEMLECATCDDAIRILDEAGIRAETLDRIQKRIGFIMNNKVLGQMETGAILFSKEYGFLCQTEDARSILDRIKKEEL